MRMMDAARSRPANRADGITGAFRRQRDHGQIDLFRQSLQRGQAADAVDGFLLRVYNMEMAVGNPVEMRRLRRMIRPGFMPLLEAPMTTALRGRSRFSILCSGRGKRAIFFRENLPTPSTATRRPSAASSIGFISSSSRVKGDDSASGP